MFSRFLVVFCLSLTTAYVNAAEVNAQQIMQNMSQAMKTLEYQGTVAFFKNGRLDTMKYFHSCRNGQEQERLLSLNSPMREVIREAGKVRCVFKKTNATFINNRPVRDSFIVDLPEDFVAIQNVYSFKALDEESVAMLPTYVILIEPKDQYRYKRKIWIDKVYYLPLKSEVYDLQGTTVEQVVFTDIQVNNEAIVDKSGFNEKELGIVNQQAELLAIDKAGIVLQKIPSHYHIAFFEQMNGDKKGKQVDHVFLSDGFSSVSVYVETKAKDTIAGLQVLGSVKSMTIIIGDFQVTVLGEVPAKAVQFIAQGIKLKK